ncbi:thioesterase family protein [Kordiimonas sp.]|uniref:thioesterase family protein n=1 Tax=Kordiimonas sp. TaxID=1970157 RepID=UPI003A8D4240
MQERLFGDILSDVDGADAVATLTPGWMQGRAAYGGLVGGLLVAGMRQALKTPKPIRSLMVSFVGPAPAGDVQVVSSVLREGRNVTQATSQVRAGDAVCAQAMASFGDARETKSAAPNVEFKPEPRESVPPLEGAGRLLPPFLQYFDGHWTGGGVPMTGTEDRRLGMWVKHKSDMTAYPAEALVGLADIPPPVMMSHYKTPVMASSLSWSLEFLMEPENVKADWFYLDYTLEAAKDGYSQQSGMLFTEAGDLVALSRQCMVYFE